MQDDPRRQARRMLLATMLRKVRDDRYPSSTQMDMIEDLLEPDDVPLYAEILLEHVADERFPSVPMMQRLQRVTA
ncbi:hypothetical protein KLP28_09595 [Nocardioidaceae bacterium]|nr:hypothetical protein KLP28_09595 [Nocardioidaceae bacterium]